MDKTIIVLLADYPPLREKAGYVRALQRAGCRVLFWPPGRGLKELEAQLSTTKGRVFILHPDQGGPLDPYLTRISFPTVSMQVDTFSFTKRRMIWANLFDYVLVFHPGFDTVLRSRGHEGVLLNPHAVDAEFLVQETGDERPIEIGWVGSAEGPYYGMRRRLLPKLQESFRMNDWNRPLPTEQMMEIYRSSKIVVNLPGDHWPIDANLRAFEAMASGAAVLTHAPSELSDLGFDEGKHYLGYEDEESLIRQCRLLLSEDGARDQIARAGLELVRDRHTYDHRVASLLRTFEEPRAAPARGWSHGDVLAVCLDYAIAHRHSSPMRVVRAGLRLGVASPGRLPEAARRQLSYYGSRAASPVDDLAAGILEAKMSEERASR